MPSGASTVTSEMRIYCNTENNYDGVFLEYTTNGSTWTKVTSFAFGGYTGNINGSNTSCNNTNSQAAWDSGTGYRTARTNSLPVAGNWLRFRFIGMEDGSVNKKVTTENVQEVEEEGTVKTALAPDMFQDPPAVPENSNALYKWSPDKGVEFVKEIVQEENNEVQQDK